MSNEPHAFRLTDPSRVLRVALERSDDGLTITLRLAPLDGATPIEPRFTGAADVRFRGNTTLLEGIVLLMVEDISSRGWEGARFLVRDYEEEFMSFVCRDIEPPLRTEDRASP